MRDLTKTGYSSSSPARSYYNLNERLEALESKLNRLEQGLIEVLARLNKI